MMNRMCVWVLMAAMTSATALGQFDSGSDGSDGVLTVAPGQDVVIDLGSAANAEWTSPSPVAGNGVYDAVRWAVVFKYTTVAIGANATVRFVNHPKGAPVVWLATGDVVINGHVVLDGDDGSPVSGRAYAEPGPGGFAGGVGVGFSGVAGSGGFGPGGGGTGDGGGFGTGGFGGNGGDSYGQEAIVPLIGGSGGGGRSNADFGGGAGGGAILIGSNAGVIINAGGEVSARGGSAADDNTDVGSGSGGAIRLVANRISGGGSLVAPGATEGDNGGDGRIRFEAPEITFSGTTTPNTSVSFAPGQVFASLAPELTVVSVRNELGVVFSVSDDPDARVTTTDAEVTGGTTYTVDIAARFVPPGTTVLVLVARANGTPFRFTSDPLAGTFNSSTTTAGITLSQGRADIQLRANWTP